MKINLREMKLKDIDSYYKWNLPHNKHYEFDGPYYKKITIDELDAQVSKIKDRLIIEEPAFSMRQFIVDEDDNLIGSVGKYYKSKETNWLEIGITIYDPKNWGKGIGKEALKLWINKVFEDHPELVRLGLSTWSGNIGMMKLAEKLGLKLEARYVNARIVNGEYFDSVSYGILKKDWMEKNE